MEAVPPHATVHAFDSALKCYSLLLLSVFLVRPHSNDARVYSRLVKKLGVAKRDSVCPTADAGCGRSSSNDGLAGDSATCAGRELISVTFFPRHI